MWAISGSDLGQILPNIWTAPLYYIIITIFITTICPKKMSAEGCPFQAMKLKTLSRRPKHELNRHKYQLDVIIPPRAPDAQSCTYVTTLSPFSQQIFPLCCTIFYSLFCHQQEIELIKVFLYQRKSHEVQE